MRSQRPGSSPTTRRTVQAHRRPTSGAFARCNHVAAGDASESRSMAVTGSSPALLGAGPGMQMSSISGYHIAPGTADRPKCPKMMGALTSTFSVPLQECNTFERLRSATASMVIRTCREAPLQVAPGNQPDQAASESGVALGPIAIGECSPAREGSPDAAATRGGEAAVRQALVIAATRQCIRLLHQGWESVEAAATTVPILIGLREDGLLSPLSDVQAAALDALVGLVSSSSSVARRSKTVGPPAPGSFAAWTAPGSPVEARSKGARPPSATQLDIQCWAQQAQVFASLSEAGLLPPDSPSRTASLLEAELRRSLRAPTPQDLKRAAKNLAEGGSWLARALATERSPANGAVNSEATCASQRITWPQEAPETIRAIVAASLRTATHLDRDGPAVAGAREALRRVGLIDDEELADCSVDISSSGRLNLPKRSSSAPGFSQALPELRRSPPKVQQQHSVLESGMQQLQAAKAAFRQGRQGPPAGNVGPRSVMGIRR